MSTYSVSSARVKITDRVDSGPRDPRLALGSDACNAATRYLPFAGDVAAYRVWDSIKTVEIAWTRVHAISDFNTCLKEENKWM